MELVLEKIFLGIYVVAWMVTLVLYQKKRHSVDAGTVIIGTFLLCAVFSFFLYGNDFYGDEFHSITLFPFIYLFIMTIISCSPIFRYTGAPIREIVKPNMLVFNGVSILMIVCTIIDLTQTLPNVVSGITRIIIESEAGVEIYKDSMDASSTMNIGDGKIESITSVLSGVFADVSVLMCFYNLTLPKRNKWITIGLFIAALNPIIYNLSISQRGPATTALMTIVISYFAVVRFVPDSIKRKVRMAGIVMLVLFTIPIAAITASRFNREGTGGAGASYLYYLGQQNLSFDMYAFDNNGIRYGDRTFPIFKRMLGFSNVPRNFHERRVKYPHLKINDETFIGYVGDFVLDYGPIIAFIIFVFFTSFVNNATRVRNNRIYFHQLILVHFVMCVVFQGSIKLFTYADLGNLKILGMFILYFAFNIFQNPPRQKAICPPATIELD